jgi:hypothetical protein
MSSPQRRYLVLEQGVGSMIVNFPLNGLIAWAFFRKMAEVPLWGEWGDQSIAGDTIVTSFLLPLFTCLFVTRAARGAVQTGHVPPLGWTRATHPILRLLPRATFQRGALLGLVCALTVGPLAVKLFGVVGLTPLRLWSFIVLKATYAAVLGLFVTPTLALWAIAEPARQ